MFILYQWKVTLCLMCLLQNKSIPIYNPPPPPSRLPASYSDVCFFQSPPGSYNHSVDERDHTVEEWKSEYQRKYPHCGCDTGLTVIERPQGKCTPATLLIRILT